MVMSREGFTIDVLAAFARKTVLNPWLAVPLAVLLEWRPATLVSTDLHPILRSFAVGSALVGVSLCLNDWLNKWSANNWTSNLLDWNWDNEIVLITGGSGGIGASIAQRLLAQNIKTTAIIVDYVPLTWVPEGGTSVKYYKCDLSDSSAIKSLCSQIRLEVGQPTVLVNNAGLCRGFTIMEGSYHDVELTIHTNLVAPFLLIKEFLPHMVETNHGHIMNISSMSSLIPPAKLADYAATKAGIIAMHESLQLELRHIHNAPKVRLSLGIFSFIKTPLFRGETRQSSFLFPLLDVDTVGEALADILYSGYGMTIYLPGLMRQVAMLRGAPEWVMRAVREGTQALGVDFTGRQKLDIRTGLLE